MTINNIEEREINIEKMNKKQQAKKDNEHIKIELDDSKTIKKRKTEENVVSEQKEILDEFKIQLKRELKTELKIELMEEFKRDLKPFIVEIVNEQIDALRCKCRNRKIDCELCKSFYENQY